MPIYGKGQNARARPNYPKIGQRASRIFHVAKGKVVLKRKTYFPKKDYEVHQTTLADLVEATQFNALGFLHERHQKSKQPLTVFELGCGNGRMLSEINRRAPYAHCFGFSRDSYPEWKGNEHAVFIQNNFETVFRYLKPIGPVDLMISHYGLFHLKTGAGKEGFEKYAHYIGQLTPHLSVGGKIVLYPLKRHEDMEPWQEALGPQGKNVEIEVKGFALILTRKH